MVWAGAKNLVSNKLEAVDGELMYVMKDGDKLCEKYSPENLEDFDPNQHYGVVRGEQMVLFHIRGLDVTKEKILDRIETPRHPQQIRGKKRLSSTQPSIPIAEIVNGKEIAEAMKKSEAKRLKQQAAGESAKQVLKQYLSAETDESSNGKKRKKEHQDEQSDSKKEHGEKKSKKKTDRKDKQSNATGQEKEIDGMDKQSNATRQEKEIDGKEGQINVGSQDLPPCTGNCQMVRFLQVQIENLTEGLKTKSSEPQKGIIGNVNDKFGVPSPEALEDGMIHIGDSITIKYADVTEAECSTFDRRARVDKLLEICFPKDFKLRTLDPAGMKDTKRDWLPISKANVRCIQKLLNHMAERDGITSSYKDPEVRGLISKVSKYNRDKMDFEELSEEDKKKIQEGRKEKAKQLRQQRNQKKKEERKKKKDEEKSKKKEEKAKKRQTDEDAMDKSGSDSEKSVKLNSETDSDSDD